MPKSPQIGPSQDNRSLQALEHAQPPRKFTERLHKRALIVDDDPVVCELVKTVLSSTGLEVLSLTRSGEAWKHLQAEKFAVVLFDFRMPSPDGLELSRQVRGAGLNQMTPIILLSDDQSTGAVSKGFAAGASVFLYKPLDRTRLLKLLRVTQGAIEYENQRFRRVALCSKVRLDFEKGEVEGETINASLNGLLVKVQSDAPVGSPVKVRLYLAPDMEPIVGSGLVVRILDANHMGIQLNSLSAAESRRLQDFLLPLILKEGLEASLIKAA
jgi:CheY-like chemotaxis protein